MQLSMELLILIKLVSLFILVQLIARHVITTLQIERLEVIARYVRQDINYLALHVLKYAETQK